MADPVVHITNGVPDSGTGNITTLGAVVTALGTPMQTSGGTVALAAGAAVIGHVVVDTLPSGAVTLVSGAVASGAFASGALASGSVASGAMVDVGAIADAAVAAGATGSLSAKLRAISRDIVANIVLAAGTALLGKVGIDQTTDGTTNKVAADLRVGGAATDKGSGTGGTATQRIIVDSSQIGTQQTTFVAAATGYTLVALPNDQVWPKGMSPKGFAAAFTTLTRPANVTAYSAGDSISNNATAASVTALSATVSDTNNDPVTITDILISSTDTGLAGKRIRAYLFNSDPTANTGTQAGDNAAFSQKVAGYIGSFSGVLETGFFDGTVGRLVPSYNDGATAPIPNAPAGGLVVSPPTSGAKTLFLVVQTLDAFTPSANSTTIIGIARGFQGRVG